MAAEAITPTDETGIPYPILPASRSLPLPGTRAHNTLVADWHHHMHPRAILIGDDLGRRALRYSRVQWVDYEAHHLGYHRYYAGPKLPETNEEIFKLVVMAAAGYIPAMGIDLSNRDHPTTRHISPKERKALWLSRSIRIEPQREGTISEYLRAYALQQDFPDAFKGETIDEFIHTTNERRRRELGKTFLHLATYCATEKVASTYLKARQRNLIYWRRAQTADRFVFSFIWNSTVRQHLFRALEHRLDPSPA